jgi:butyryl-CoA dehydrogenase
MAIDFTLTAQQRELQLASRKFAKEVLTSAGAAELLAFVAAPMLAAV